MKKGIVTLTAAATILTTLGLPFSNAHAEEKEVSKKIKVETQSTENFNNSQSPLQVSANLVSTGPQEGPAQPNDSGHNWRYVNTKYGNNVAYNNFDYYMQQAILAGFGGSLTNLIPYSFVKGVANLFAGKAILSIPKGKNVWYKVEKYWDKDAYNSYVLYKVWIWSDSGRKNLISYYEQDYQS